MCIYSSFVQAAAKAKAEERAAERAAKEKVSRFAWEATIVCWN